MKIIKYNYNLFLSMLLFLMTFFCVIPFDVKAVEYTSAESTSLIEWMMNGEDLENGYYALKVNGTTYNIHLYVLEGDQVWTSNKTFGDSGDIGTASSHAKHMVAVLVKGNLTIESGVTVTATKSTYGGPKGLFIYTAGDLTNKGTITMYGRGAYAAGQNVYLWYDKLNGNGYTGYTVPAAGGAGAVRSTTRTLYNDGGNFLHGNNGTSGTGRATGGGGSGAVRNYVARMYPGSGAAGTSYSGGSGGGAAATDRASSRTAGSGAANGGPGGHGAQGGAATGNSGGSTNGWGQAPGGGQGNGPGNNVWSHAVASVPAQDTGTGGLLILFCRSLNNTGNINANGVTARYTTVTKWNGSQGGGHILSGGSSGGGSVNIFYTELVSKGTITATGGPSQKKGMAYYGGAGGNGTVTLSQLVLEEEFLNPTLSNLEVENQTMFPSFSPNTFEYGVTLDSESSTVNIIGTLTHSENVITSGVGEVDIPIGSSTHNVVITSKVGVVQVYSIDFYRPPSSYKYLKGITVNGESIEGFNPEKLTYDITLPYNYDTFELDVLRGRTSQEVYGTGTIVTKSGDNKITITVVSEDGNYVTNYTLNIFREHSSKLKSITIDEYDLEPEFDPETNSYSVTIMSTALSVNVSAEAYDEEAVVTLKGFGYVSSSKTGTITVTEPNVGTTTYTINIIKEGSPAITKYTYSYTGEYQEFVAPATGFYQIELWGAQGGNAVGNNSRTCSYNRGKAYGNGCGGFGAYTSGVIKLNKDDILYVYVGQRGLDGKARTDRAGGWNGGGSSTHDHADNEASGSGGGATDIRLVATSAKNKWNEFASLKSRIMVAAGGGGGSDVYIAGNGGTLNSTKTRFSNIATQTSGYAFGYGENSIYRKSNIDVGGGGSGYFGGYSTAMSSSNYGNFGHPGTGGSSFVSGCTGCKAIDESSSSQSELKFTDSNEHYSGYVFTDITMLAGGTSMPTSTTGYSVGNVSNGYARITLVSKSQNNFLSNILVKADGVIKTYTPDFDLETKDYYVTLGTDETEIEISARPEDSKATINGLGKYDIEAGTTDIDIAVTAEDGSVRIYTVHVTRPASTVSKPLDIIISGLVPSLCSVNESFCKLNPATFDPDTNTYYLTVPSRIKQLYFDVEKAHKYQFVVGEGKVSLDGGENIITIEVTSEDGNNKNNYHYYITRDMTGNTDLARLEIVDPEREINYDPDITEYYISVPNEYTEIKELIVETDDENASYVVTGNENFVPGMNQVYIVVTAANGETKIYVLNVYRERNSNVYISSLEVKDENKTYELTPEFNKVYLGEYLLTVPNEISNIEIVATPEVNTTTVTGIGKKALKTGINKFPIVATAEDGSVETYELSITREKNDNTNLSSITVSDGNETYELTPKFESSITEYDVEVKEGITNIKISATPEVNTTTYKLLDSNTIKVGKNVKRILVIAEDGSTKTYTININRPANTNTNLNSLILSDGEKEYSLTPAFDKTETSYVLEVENNVKTLNVISTPENVLSKITGNGKYSLTVGDNEIFVTVISESGDEKTYTINVNRKPNSNPYLSSITTSSGILVPEFNKDIKEYSLNVGSTINIITITGTPEAIETKVTGNGNYNLVTGENKVTLVTLAEDGVSTETYEITIIKDKSDNANIKELTIEEGVLSPKFNSEIISYTTKVPYDVEKATFHVELEHENATYEIIGNENFQVGDNEVSIVVTGEDGTTKLYNIVVTRREESASSNYLTKLEVSEGKLTPEFTKEKLYYEVEVPFEVSNITVTGESESEEATINGLGSYNLNVGTNLISVTVTSYDGIDRDYQIKVTRLKNTDARLSNIVVAGSTLSPTFDKNVTEYALTTTEPKLTFTKIEKVDSNATYEIIGNDNLTLGDNKVTIKVTAQDGITTKEYTLNVTKNPGNNNNLASLEVEGYTITPTFSKATTLYKLTVPNEVRTVNVLATPEDPNATVIGTGNISVNTGENQIVVEVTSESGITKAYTILLTKEGSSNNLLSNLVVNNGTMSPEFDPNTNTYNVSVSYFETELDLTVVLDDYNATYEVLNNELKVGSNKVTVAVKSEKGTINNYVLNVTREEFITALLENIEVKNYKLSKDFNSYITSYDILVDNEITSLDLTIIPIDKNATYVVTGNENFVIGTNEVKINVTSSDGKETMEYVLNVTRQAYSNAYLDYLYTSLGDVTPTFDKTVLSYSINVANDQTKIELIGEAVDKSTTVTGLGEHDLKTGENVLPITVTTTTGIKRTYYVTVNRAKATNNYLNTLEVKVGNNVYTLNPEFDKTINNYTLTLPIGTQNITFEGTVDQTATVSGLGTKVVNVGNNVYEISVTSENGDINVYTITVEREASSNNYLTDLVPSIGSFETNFSYTETDYTLKLDSAAGLLSFDCITEDMNATVSGNKSQVVPDGESTRTIIVTAEDGSTRTYNIKVIKDRTDNAKLSELSVKDYNFDITFDPDTYEYKIVVPNNKNILLATEVIAVAQDKNAKITKMGNMNLVTGENKYVVTVTAPDGFTSTEYTIVVEREKGSNSLLNNLVAKTGSISPNFNPMTLNYEWVVEKGYTVTPNDLIVEPADANATINMTESLEIKNLTGNIYEIKITSEDGTSTTTYTLNVTFDLSDDNTLKELTIDKGYYLPTLNSEIYTYDVYEYVDTTSINIDATTTSETATIVSGLGEVTLTDEETLHTITVTSESGVTQVYNLNIHRTILNDKYLKNLGLNGLDNLDCINGKCKLSPTFEPEKSDYSIKVPYEYTNLDILVSKNEQQTVKYKVNGEYITTYTLPLGKTTVTIEVYDGMNSKTMEYTLEVERCKSNNANLSSLKVVDYELDPVFDKTALEYTVNVPSDVDSVEIVATAEDSNASVNINGYNYLLDGENEATVTVTAPDGTQKTYIIHIIKSPLYNSYLKNITVSTGIFWDLTPKFKQTQFEYSTTVSDIYDTVTIEAVPVSSDTVISGLGEFDIVTGLNTFTITTTAIDGSTSIYKLNVLKQSSVNVNLSTLIVEEGDLSPSFDKGQTKYNVNVDSDVSKLTIHAIPEHKTSTYIITGNENLQSGINKVNIIVMSEDKSVSKTYQLTVHKAKSTQNKLSSLTVSDDDMKYELVPTFESEVSIYDVYVPEETEKVYIQGTPISDAATISGLGEEYLNHGSNLKYVTVTAESGDIYTYTLNIYREYNLKLKDLINDYGDLEPKFSSDILEYTITVPKDKSEITFIAFAESNKVSVSGTGTYSLIPGDNQFDFVVTSPDNHQLTYTVNVIREKDDNNYIKSLQVNGVINPTFDRDTEEYTVDIKKDVNNLDLVIELESEKASYEVLGNSNFKDIDELNKVIIRVTAENGSTRDYVLNTYRRSDEYFSNRLLNMTINYGTLTPDFNPDINNYAVTVPNSISEIIVETTKEDEYATVTGDGKLPLELGRNTFDIVVTNREGKQNIYSIIVYRIENSDATLKSLTIQDINYQPIFNKLVTSYTVDIGSEYDKLDITAIPTDPNATVEITNNNFIPSGQSTININVTAPDNVTKMTYTLLVTKSLSKNNYLKDLNVTNFEFDKEFNKQNTGPYIINVDSHVNSINVNAIPDVNSATVTGDGNIKLTTGKNLISVNVVSESGELRTYSIIVNKAADTDSTLKDILLSDGDLDPEFDPAILDYEVVVPEEVESITVTGITNSSNATIKGNGSYDIVEKETIIPLTVTAEDGSKTTYNVKVIRNIETSSKLKNLIVKNGELYPGFHKLITSYTILVPNEVTSLDMLITLEDEEATYEVVGNSNLKLGSNKVSINVTSKDKSNTTSYVLSVVRQASASNFLRTLEVDDYKLIPEFNKTTLFYEVSVPLDVDRVNVRATVEDSTSTISGTGVKSVEPGDNIFYVTVESASGCVRTYQILVRREKSKENLLLELNHDVGTISPEFDPKVNEYTITVPNKTTSITLDGEVSVNSQVTGLGTFDVSVGTMQKNITVTSQSGDTNIYKINIVRNASNSTELESLTPSSGTLNYSNDKLSYDMEVEDDVTFMSFAAVTKDPDATVTGNDIKMLNYGDNTFEIKVTAEDGVTTRTININIYRKKDLKSITVEPKEVLLERDETVSITYTLDPIDTSYPEVEFISNDESVATVDNNGTIKAVYLGVTTIDVRSKKDNSIYASVIVNVINKKLVNNIYDINRDGDVSPYIIGLEPKTKYSDFAQTFDNNPSTVFIYDADGNEITDVDKFMGTSMVVKLIINDVEYDSLNIVVRGDLTGDGILNITDYNKLNTKLLRKVELTECESLAADTNSDAIINITDYNKLNSYLLKKVTTLN